MRNGRWYRVGHKHIEKAEEANLKPKFFVLHKSTVEEHVCGVKFAGISGTVGFIAIRNFSFFRRERFVK